MYIDLSLLQRFEALKKDGSHVILYLGAIPIAEYKAEMVDGKPLFYINSFVPGANDRTRMLVCSTHPKAQDALVIELRCYVDMLKDNRGINKGEKMSEKTLKNSDVSKTKDNVFDLQTFGNNDMFKLLCKASSQAEGWMKSTKAMEVVGGCIVQVTTQQKNPDGSYALAEALTYVPGVCVVGDEKKGRELQPISTNPHQRV